MYCSGSGFEEVMKPGERYVLLLESKGDKLRLLRAEKTSELARVKRSSSRISPGKERLGRKRCKVLIALAFVARLEADEIQKTKIID